MAEDQGASIRHFNLPVPSLLGDLFREMQNFLGEDPTHIARVTCPASNTLTIPGHPTPRRPENILERFWMELLTGLSVSHFGLI